MTSLPSSLEQNLVDLNAAIAALNNVAYIANPQINPLWTLIQNIKGADWNSPVRLVQDKTSGDNPYLGD